MESKHQATKTIWHYVIANKEVAMNNGRVAKDTETSRNKECKNEAGKGREKAPPGKGGK